MRAHPIIFSGPMVWALMDGRKTQTRRPVKPQPQISERGGFIQADRQGREWAYGLTAFGKPNARNFSKMCCPYGQPGDLLWVREKIHLVRGRPFYARDSRIIPGDRANAWAKQRRDSAMNRPGSEFYENFYVPSIHMPRWASRITLYLNDVRVERVQDIQDRDALAEGIDPADVAARGYKDATVAFSNLWDSLNAKRGFAWHDNPWVWVLTFCEILANVDQVLAEPEVYIPERPEAMA